MSRCRAVGHRHVKSEVETLSAPAIACCVVLCGNSICDFGSPCCFLQDLIFAAQVL